MNTKIWQAANNFRKLIAQYAKKIITISSERYATKRRYVEKKIYKRSG